MFVNFALNKDPHLRAALMTAMRQVARLDYVAIAQHFNGQLADEDPPIMTSAGFVLAQMSLVKNETAVAGNGRWFRSIFVKPASSACHGLKADVRRAHALCK